MKQKPKIKIVCPKHGLQPSNPNTEYAVACSECFPDKLVINIITCVRSFNMLESCYYKFNQKQNDKTNSSRRSNL